VPPAPPPYAPPLAPEGLPEVAGAPLPPLPRAEPDRPPRVPQAAYDALREVYRSLDAEVARLAPRCDARGVCCDFDLVDHVLYASALEIDLVKEHLPRERYERDTGNRCPLLEDGRCGARDVRMLGCRTYFCQPGWEPHASELYERHYARIQAIAREHGLDWSYAPALRLMRDGT